MSIISNSTHINKLHYLAKNKDKLLAKIRESVVGYDLSIKTPYGDKTLIYSDYTASGRFISFIEEYIQNQIYPFYGNTHSVSSWSAKQTTYFREEARTIVKRCVNASERDALIFSGSGSTQGINRLVSILRIKELVKQIEEKEKYNLLLSKIQAAVSEKSLDIDISSCLASFGQEEEENKISEKNFCIQNRWGSFDCILCKTICSTMGTYELHKKSEIHQKNVEHYMATEAEKKVDKMIKPVIFVSIFEHNSNLLPWRETGAILILIEMTEEGDLDYEQLESELIKYKEHKVKIGSFSAGSNLTGVLFDVDRIAYILHKNNALAFFDYASVAPYVKINMNGLTVARSQEFLSNNTDFEKLCYKDALFISPHKFVGGPNTPGILVAKKALFGNAVPIIQGGGTVFFVNDQEHLYLTNIEEREEGGTPEIIGAIRAGLVFQLKEAVGEDTIMECESKIIEKVNKRLSSMENMIILGNPEREKVGIYSFVVKSHTKLLHHNYVSTLLNDLFGIQARGGCSCAGMYGQRLLGVDLKFSRELKGVLCEGHEILRVGYVRLNFNYFLAEDEVDYILSALDFICNYGWLFLPSYTFNPDTSEWLHRLHEKTNEKRHWLGEIDYSSGEMQFEKNITFGKKSGRTFNEFIEDAYNEIYLTLDKYRQIYGKSNVDQKHFFPEHVENIRWFLLPSEVLYELLNLKKINEDQLNKLLNKEELKIGFIPKTIKSKAEITHYIPTKGEEEAKLISEDAEEGDFLFPDLETQASIITNGDKVISNKGKKLNNTNAKIKNKALLPKISKKVLHCVGNAISDFEMIKEGDRILVALSGGKDSLSLLHILNHFSRKSPLNFSIGAVTVDPQTPDYNPRPLIPYLESLGIPYFYESEPIVERANSCMENDSICSFCSRMKRGILYSCARREGYNVIAMGQHLDDLAESLVMSIFHNGYLRTMKANYTIDKGDLRVIRPLVYGREKLFKDLATENSLPVITENCPACFSAPKERHRVKILLAQQEHHFPNLFSSLLKSMKPIMKGNLRDLLGKEFFNKEEGDEEDEFNLVI